MGYGKEITIKMVNKKYKDSYAIENLIKYTVTDKKRKKDCRYRGGHGVYYMNAKKAAEQFRIVQRYYKKQTGKRVHHMIISFEESTDDLYAMDSLAKIIVYDILREYQSVYAIHEDTDNLHIHIVWNAVNFLNGRKWHISKSEFSKLKKDIKRSAKQEFCKDFLQ